MNGRLRELDSLRGLAALSVVFFHYLLVFPKFQVEPYTDGVFTTIVKYTPFRIFWGGHEAVIFFFMLSGFVLSLPFLKNKEVSYSKFITKRFVRIYIPYILVVISAIFLRVNLSREGIPKLSDWFNVSWTSDVSLSGILSHITLITSFRNWDFDPVLWSLVHEMRVSLIFPFLMIFIIKNKWHKTLLVFLGLSFLGFAGTYVIEHFLSYQQDYLETLQYLLFFVIGALLAKHIDEILIFMGKLKKSYKIGVIVISLLTYTYTWWFLPFVKILHVPVFNEWVSSIGVTGFILLALSSKTFSSILKNKVLTWLGDISYSLYLVHALILLSFINTFYNKVDLILLVGLSFVVTLFVSHLMYKYVETPSIKLGRALVNNKRMNIKKKPKAS